MKGMHGGRPGERGSPKGTGINGVYLDVLGVSLSIGKAHTNFPGIFPGGGWIAPGTVPF